MDIETKLYEEILSELEKLKGHEAGSTEHKAILDEVTKLMDRAIEIEKINASATEKTAAREADEKLKNMELELEREMKQKQLDEDRKDRLARNWIAGIGLGVTTVSGVWMTLKGLKFEETGSICSPLVRGWLTKWIPRK